MDKNHVPNVYDCIDKKFLKKHKNPYYNDHLLSVPFRMAVVGGSGSQKTSTVVYILSKLRDTFDHIYYYCRSKDEPLLDFLESELEGFITIREGISELPVLQKDKNSGKIERDFTDEKKAYLVVFDDLCLEKDQSKISEYFIRARKTCAGISLIYISQSYHQIPKIIRLQSSYLILKKLSSKRDLRLILSDAGLDVSIDTLYRMYSYCVRKQSDFFMVDAAAPPEARFRHNLLEILDAADFEDGKTQPRPSSVSTVDAGLRPAHSAAGAASAAPPSHDDDEDETTTVRDFARALVRKARYEN